MSLRSQHHLQRGILTTRASVSKKQQNIFSQLIAAYLTCALCCYLQASTFIPTQCDTSQVPPLPPSCWFRSCPFLSGFYPKASVGDRIILRVVINCISYFFLCTSTVPLALSAGCLSCEILEAYKEQQWLRDTGSNDHYKQRNRNCVYGSHASVDCGCWFHATVVLLVTHACYYFY